MVRYICILLGLFIGLASCNQKTFEAQLEEYSNQIQTVDALVVPGYPHDGESWDIILKTRLVWAKYLMDNGLAKKIIFSGGAVHSPIIEAEVMRAYAIQMGIPSENILIETDAEHTSENLYYSYKLAKKEGFSKIAVASDPYQTKFLKYHINYINANKPIKVIPLTVDYEAIKNELLLVKEPKLDFNLYKKKNFKPLQKKDSKSKRWIGTLGGNVDWSEL